LQKAQTISQRIEKLPDGRIRYYTKEIPSKTLGRTKGASHVTEFNPETGQVRSWQECYDQMGNVNRVHPKNIDGQDLISQHYPPTKTEKELFSSKPRSPR
jgi:filamentous hemagglutinin